MKFIISILLLGLSLGSFAQLGSKGRPVYLDIDTLKGADTIYIELPELTGYYSLSWELYFEEVGGTSDGTGILECANDTIYSTLNSSYNIIQGLPNDSITISNGLNQTYWIFGTPGNNFRVKLMGTAGDTTRIISNYIRK